MAMDSRQPLAWRPPRAWGQHLRHSQPARVPAGAPRVRRRLCDPHVRSPVLPPSASSTSWRAGGQHGPPRWPPSRATAGVARPAWRAGGGQGTSSRRGGRGAPAIVKAKRSTSRAVSVWLHMAAGLVWKARTRRPEHLTTAHRLSGRPRVRTRSRAGPQLGAARQDAAHQQLAPFVLPPARSAPVHPQRWEAAGRRPRRRASAARAPGSPACAAPSRETRHQTAAPCRPPGALARLALAGMLRLLAVVGVGGAVLVFTDAFLRPRIPILPHPAGGCPSRRPASLSRSPMPVDVGSQEAAVAAGWGAPSITAGKRKREVWLPPAWAARAGSRAAADAAEFAGRPRGGRRGRQRCRPGAARAHPVPAGAGSALPRRPAQGRTPTVGLHAQALAADERQQQAGTSPGLTRVSENARLVHALLLRGAPPHFRAQHTCPAAGPDPSGHRRQPASGGAGQPHGRPHCRGVSTRSFCHKCGLLQLQPAQPLSGIEPLQLQPAQPPQADWRAVLPAARVPPPASSRAHVCEGGRAELHTRPCACRGVREAVERAFWELLQEGLQAQPWQWQRLGGAGARGGRPAGRADPRAQPRGGCPAGRDAAQAGQGARATTGVGSNVADDADRWSLP